MTSAHTIMPTLVRRNGKTILHLFFIIHERGRDRLIAHDPMSVAGSTIAALSQKIGDFGCTHLHDVVFDICFEENEEEFHQKCAELKEPAAIIRYLRRGWKDLPEDRIPAHNIPFFTAPNGEIH